MINAPTARIFWVEIAVTACTAILAGISAGSEWYGLAGFFVGISAYWFRQMVRVRMDVEKLMRRREDKEGR